MSPPRQKLWNYFSREHELELLDSELNDIVHAVRELLAGELELVDDPNGPYWTVRDKDGHLDHTVIRMEKDEAIKEFIKGEQMFNALYNAGRIEKGMPTACAPSWEYFESQGYSLVPVRLEEIRK